MGVNFFVKKSPQIYCLISTLVLCGTNKCLTIASWVRVCVWVGSNWFLSMYGMWQANNIDKWDRLFSDAAPKIFARILNFKRACSMHSLVCTNKCVCSCGCYCNRSAFINFNFNSWFIFVVCFLTYFPCVFLFCFLLLSSLESLFSPKLHFVLQRKAVSLSRRTDWDRDGVIRWELLCVVSLRMFLWVFRASSSHSLSHYFR